MIIRILFAAYISIWLTSCANIQNLTGGVRDVLPPKIDSTRSTPNRSTHFDKKEINLTFDEFINLDNPYQNIIISPPLKEKPEITLKGKTINIKFGEKDTFKTNTTYSINFGESIKDLHEGNIAKNLKFVFSTGDKIDSLSISAKLTDAKTKAPIANGLLMLYDKNEDSIVAKSLPFYFSKSDKEGNLTITNIHEGNYKLFALQDGNANYLYDNEKESIAYLDTMIRLQSNIDSLELQLFVAEPDYKILDKTQAQGYTSVLYNKNPENIKIRIEPTLAYTKYIDKDTLKILYTKNDTNSYNLIFTDFENNKDTVEIPKSTRKLIQDSIKIQNLLLSSNFNTMNQLRNPSLVFNVPISKIESSLITSTEDSTQKVDWSWKVDTNDNRIINIKGVMAEDKTYNIKLLPKALTTFQNISNDTLVLKFRTLLTKNLGNIKLKIKDLESSKNYLLTVGSEASGIIYTEKIKNKSTFEAAIKGLYPELYELKIIEDDNKNDIQDSGNYWKHKKAEKIFNKKLDQLRANWDLEVEYSIKE